MAEGCRVCICARGSEGLAEGAVDVEASARRPGMVAAVQADVSTSAGVELVVSRTLETFGGLDILVNNVGRATGEISSKRRTPSGRRPLTRRSFPRSARRGLPSRT